MKPASCFIGIEIILFFSGNRIFASSLISKIFNVFFMSLFTLIAIIDNYSACRSLKLTKSILSDLSTPIHWSIAVLINFHLLFIRKQLRQTLEVMTANFTIGTKQKIRLLSIIVLIV